MGLGVEDQGLAHGCQGWLIRVERSGIISEITVSLPSKFSQYSFFVEPVDFHGRALSFLFQIYISPSHSTLPSYYYLIFFILLNSYNICS